MEPMKHQYDFDSATVVGFLKEHGLDKDFKLNIEANHATLSGHTFEHDLQVASDHGLLGSIDANRGNAQNGWDTDQFPSDLYDTVGAMLVVLRQGGLEGGLNFDAKVRRESTDLEDLFIAHIGGMDAFARGLEVAHALLTESPWEQWRKALREFRQRRRPGVRAWHAQPAGPGGPGRPPRRTAPGQRQAGALRNHSRGLQAAGSGENTRLIVLISVVATIGGFLFGFDSGVINGTQDGLHLAFRSGEWMQGFEIASMLLLCGGRVQCRPPGRPPRPSQRADPVGGDVPAVGTRCWGGGLVGLVHCGAGGGGSR